MDVITCTTSYNGSIHIVGDSKMLFRRPEGMHTSWKTAIRSCVSGLSYVWAVCGKAAMTLDSMVSVTTRSSTSYFGMKSQGMKNLFTKSILHSSGKYLCKHTLYT